MLVGADQQPSLSQTPQNLRVGDELGVGDVAALEAAAKFVEVGAQLRILRQETQPFFGDRIEV